MSRNTLNLYCPVCHRLFLHTPAWATPVCPHCHYTRGGDPSKPQFTVTPPTNAKEIEWKDLPTPSLDDAAHPARQLAIKTLETIATLLSKEKIFDKNWFSYEDTLTALIDQYTPAISQAYQTRVKGY